MLTRILMPPPRRGPKSRHATESHENEKRQENQAIRNATTGADAPAPRRPAAAVMPTAMLREAKDLSSVAPQFAPLRASKSEL
jgi:hypothetical protein